MGIDEFVWKLTPNDFKNSLCEVNIEEPSPQGPTDKAPKEKGAGRTGKRWGGGAGGAAGGSRASNPSIPVCCRARHVSEKQIFSLHDKTGTNVDEIDDMGSNRCLFG